LINEEVTCRWNLDGITLDVMPTDESILGFGNRWYADAIRHSELVNLTDTLPIRIVSPVYFIATKLEAFFGRGQGDFWGSHDLEDIMTVIDGRPELVVELAGVGTELKGYISKTFTGLIGTEGFREAVAGHLPPDRASQERLPLL
jgi:hypothetical protein